MKFAEITNITIIQIYTEGIIDFLKKIIFH